jgi:membrane-associated phospholipid phosphatase
MTISAHSVYVAITEIGNLAVIGPAAVALVVWIAIRVGRPTALRVLCAIAITFTLTAGLKVVSRNVGGVLAGTPLALSDGAPSGHMSMATVVLGSVAFILLRLPGRLTGILSLVLVMITLLGVGITRVLVNAHTPADVVAGFAIGGLCASLADRDIRSPETRPRNTIQLLAIVIGLITVMHLSGWRFISTVLI